MVIESPVWTPIGSIFSIEQTMIALSLWSRITSISNSFQPIRDSSTRASWTGLISSARAIFSMNSSSSWAIEPPNPPNVKLGRMMTGYPMVFFAWMPSWTVWTPTLRGLSSPRLSTISLKRSRSSARLMLLIEAPITWTPYLSRIPFRESSMARLSPVCPPMVVRIASGLSRWNSSSTYSVFRGSM